MFKNRLLSKLDILFSPGPNYAGIGYVGALRNHVRKIRFSISSAPLIARVLVLGFMLVLSIVLTPVSAILRLMGFKFVDIDLTQIGSILFLDFYLRENSFGGSSPRWKILVLASHCSDCNRYMLDLYNGRVTFIRSTLIKFCLSPFFVSPLFSRDTSHRYEQVHGTKTNIMSVWNRYMDENGVPLVRMPEQDIELAISKLSAYIDTQKPFVTLHVRDSGFYKIASQDTRNADIFTYTETIDFLLGCGFNVIRLGDRGMRDISLLRQQVGEGLFDYALSGIKSELVDCYLLSHCAFMIGCASGPSNIPPIFHRNCVNVNWYNATNAPFFMPGDIATFKKFFDRKTQKLVPFSVILAPPFRYNISRLALEKMDIEVRDNTSVEILSTVKEFFYQTSPSTLQLRAKSMLPCHCYSVGARGNFSNTILSQYLEIGI